MATTPLSPHVASRRDELIALEVRRVIRFHRIVENADAVIARERRRALEAQENVVNSMDVLREMYGLTEAQITDLITEAKRTRHHHADDDEDDD